MNVRAQVRRGDDILDAVVPGIQDGRQSVHFKRLLRLCRHRSDLAVVRGVVRHLEFGDRLVFGVRGRLRVAADVRFPVRRHKAAVGVGQRFPRFAGPLKLPRVCPMPFPALRQLRQDAPYFIRPLPAGGGGFRAVAGFKLAQALPDPCVDAGDPIPQLPAGGIPVPGIHGLELAAVDGYQLPAAQALPPCAVSRSRGTRF